MHDLFLGLLIIIRVYMSFTNYFIRSLLIYHIIRKNFNTFYIFLVHLENQICIKYTLNLKL